MVSRTVDPGSPIDIYKSVLTEKYADFTGRARRAEYWWFVLVNFGVVIGLWIATVILGSISDALGVIGFLAIGVYYLALIIPSIALSVRRLHDTNKSGWMLLLVLIPLVGSIVLLVFYLTDGDRATNNFGPSPKYAEA